LDINQFLGLITGLKKSKAIKRGEAITHNISWSLPS
jgi:hypothetical protein